MNAARNIRISRVVGIATVVLALLSSPNAPGQGRKSRDKDYAPGDRVEVRQGNKWQVGEVVETRGGIVKVQVAGTPSNRVVSVPKQLVRRAQVADSTAADSSKPESQPLPELRVWTVSTGQHKVEAEFVEIAAGKVTLRKLDGSLAVLPLERLSEEDRGYIASLDENRGDASPDDVLRQFLVALAGGDRKETAALMVPHPNAAVLFQGQVAPPQVVSQMEKQLASEEIRQLKPGDMVSLPGGETMVVDADDVNANRGVIAYPSRPV